MSASEFDTFLALAAQGYNRIPVHRQVLADLETPLSIYLKLANTPWTYLFESVHGGEKWGRYSIIGLKCNTRLSITDSEIIVVHADGREQRFHSDDPLQFIAEFQKQFNVPVVDGLPKFTGGLVGNFSYETIRYIEKQFADRDGESNTQTKNNPVSAPDVHLMLSEEVVVFDNLAGCLHVVVLIDPNADLTDTSAVDEVAIRKAFDDGNSRIDEIVATLRESVEAPTPPAVRMDVQEDDFISNVSQSTYENAVQRARDYIRDGDIFQVVLSQRMHTAYHAHPLDLYRALRVLNPSPYMYYLNFDDYQVVGSSPEILVRLEDGEVTVRPLAGTRRRGRDVTEDRQLAEELLEDEKEIAEHVMLVDLGRNDVGRVAATGTVQTTERFVVERYSHVMHIVSHVVGKLDDSQDAIAVLKATFPAGTVSGAPKVRAMQIIDELEPDKRGVYSGAVGYIGWHGNMDTAIAIRTAVVSDNTLYIQAGAGIVADSIPEKEWEETLNKGRVIFKAVAMVSAGLEQSVGATRQRRSA